MVKCFIGLVVWLLLLCTVCPRCWLPGEVIIIQESRKCPNKLKQNVQQCSIVELCTIWYEHRGNNRNYLASFMIRVIVFESGHFDWSGS